MAETSLGPLQSVTRGHLATCPTCGSEFEQTRSNRTYCRPSCRVAAFRVRHPEGRLWDGPDGPNLSSLCPLAQDVARYFLAHLDRWVTMQELERIAGAGGWRTRRNEAMRCLEKQGYREEKRRYTYQTATGKKRVASDRMLVRGVAHLG